MNDQSRLSMLLITVLLLALSLTPVFAQETTAPYWPTDGWRTSSPEEQGMDSAELAGLMQQFRDGGISSIHSLLVIRHGYVVLDASSYPYRSDQKHELFSVTTNFVSTLVGIAIKKGLIKSVDQSIWDFLPKDGVAHMDTRKGAIQLKHLLTMTSGLDYVGVIGFRDPLYLLTEDDQPWVKWVLDQAMMAEPGTILRYTDGQAQLVSAIIQKATAMTVFDFARQNLFEPLGITDVMWLADPQGVTRAGQDLFLSPHDLAKLGYLYLRNGLWDGRQLVSSKWVKTSTSRQSNSYPYFGYFWFPYEVSGGFLAYGFGGQVIYVVPKLDLIMVATGLCKGRGNVTDIILQAVKADVALPPNPEAVQLLQAEVAALQDPKPVTVVPMPPIAGQISGKIFSLPANSEKWTAIGLICEDDQGMLVVDVAGRRLQIPVGLDGVYRVSQQGLPALPGWVRPLSDVPIAAKGGWKSADRFTVTLRDTMGMQELELYLNFKDGLKLNVFENYALSAGLLYNLSLTAIS